MGGRRRGGRGAYLAFFAGAFDHALGLLAQVLGRHDDARDHFSAGAAFAEGLWAPGMGLPVPDAGRGVVPIAAPNGSSGRLPTG